MANWNSTNRRKYISISLVCLLMGILIGLSSQVYFLLHSAGTADNKTQDLIEVIAKLESDNAELEAEIETLRASISANSTPLNDAEALDRLKTQLSSLLFAAEQTEVTGPGVILSVDDNATGAAAAANDTNNYIPENFIVHDTDLRYLLNEIGYMAEAISINGQRIVNTSSIRCVGTVIMVNSTRVAPPYEISLIGSPAMLVAAIEDSEQYKFLKSKNMPMKISRSDQIVIPASSVSQTAVFLQPAELENQQ